MCLRSLRVKVRIFRAVSGVQFDKWQLGGDYFTVFTSCAVSKETTPDEVSARCEKDSVWLQKKVSPLWMTAFESLTIDMPLSLSYLSQAARCGSEYWSQSVLVLFSKIVWTCIVTDSLWIRPTDALNFYFISITTLHVSGSLSAHHQEFLTIHRLWYIFCNCDDHLLPGAPGNKRSSQLQKMYQSRCTAKNSWWWAEMLPETHRILLPIK